MSQLLYFVPGVPSVTPAKMVACELGHLAPVSGGADIIGPENQRGCLFAGDMTTLRYDREGQTWVGGPKRNGKHLYHIGWQTDSPPTAEELQRSDLVAGVTIKTERDFRWQVPQIRDWSTSPSSEMPVWSTRLPQMVTVDDEGKPTFGDVIPRFRELFDLSMQVFVRRVSGGNELSPADMLQFAADVVAMNYHVSMFELSGKVLDCLSIDNAMAVIDAAIDVDGYLEAVKNVAGRSTPEDTDTDSGFERPMQDSDTITNQPLAS